MERQDHISSCAPEVVPWQGGIEAVNDKDTQKIAYTAGWSQYTEGKYNAAGGFKQRICGLTPKIFWILVVALVVILAAGIGAGVGGGLASQKSHADASSLPAESSTAPTSTVADISTSSTATATTTGETSTSTSSKTYGLLNSGCNATDNQYYTPNNPADDSSPFTVNNRTLKYKIHCYENIPDSMSFNNPQITKLGQLKGLRSLQECIKACATLNYVIANAMGGESAEVPFSKLCSGVVYSYQNYIAGQPINCDLNSGVHENASRVSWTDNRGPETHTQVDSAILDWED
ncbi:uncharacterized protein LDX57_012741 [Aspergillus melleus]|uniref:uncharacterized protein n=1 Tax=Aspergillus melleus TaxID=138277 RepID=UPI001E8DA836|nr:uncharacterized protein LDX57_012741 [Aspergillus melleus]KAH8435112.1 hypothetical protein LDX57_012741 [Aspergillus melleus]